MSRATCKTGCLGMLRDDRGKEGRGEGKEDGKERRGRKWKGKREGKGVEVSFL